MTRQPKFFSGKLQSTVQKMQSKQVRNGLVLLALVAATTASFSEPGIGRNFVLFYASTGKAHTQLSFPEARYCKVTNDSVDRIAAEVGDELRALGLSTTCTDKSFADALAVKAVVHDMNANILVEISTYDIEDCIYAVGEGKQSSQWGEWLVVAPCAFK